MNRLCTVFAALLFCLVSLSQPAFPQPAGDQTDRFKWSVSLGTNEVVAGRAVVADVGFTPAEGHFIYKHMLDFAVEPTDKLTLGDPEFPVAKKISDPFDPEGKEKEIYDSAAIFRVPLTVSPSTQPGRLDIVFKLRYQGCSQEICFFPTTVELKEAVTVSPPLSGTAAPEEAPEKSLVDFSAAGSTGGFQQALGKGLWFAFLFVFVAGILTSFTPCVYPLIPITISLFGAKDAGSRGRAFFLSLTYVLGIAVMYSVLGVLAAATGAVFGQMMTNPWVMAAVAAVFVFFGLSMLGLFDIQLPSSLQNRISKVGGKGFAGAFVMGLFGGIIAAPCTGPVLGGVLAFVATTQNLFLGFWLLFVFAIGLGLLFLALGTFSGLASRIPRSGGWMEGVKSVFAVILFAFALFFLREVLPVLKTGLAYSALHFGVAFALIVLGIVMGGIHKSLHNPKPGVKAFKVIGVLLLTAGLYVAIGSLAAPPPDLPQPDWVYNEAEGLKQGKEQGKPVMMDFYADWCVACVELDRYTYSDPQVLERLEDFVSIKLDFTHENPEMLELKKKYGIVGLPTVLFFDKQGELLEDKTLIGFLPPEEFLEHVEGL